MLSKIAGGCKSSITLVKGDKRVNAKRMLNVISAQINSGDENVIIFLCINTDSFHDFVVKL